MKIVSVGSSSMFRSGLAVVANTMLTHMAGDAGGAALVGGIGVANRIMMFPFSIILGFGSGFQPVAGFNWGARKYDRVQHSYRFCSIVALIGSAVMAGALALFAIPIMGVFGETGGLQQEYGALCMRLQCLALPIHAWVAVVNMLCAGLGKARGAFLLATSRQGTCFIPVLYPLVYFFQENGILAVQAVADVLTLAIGIPIAIKVTREIKNARTQFELEQQFST